MKIVKMPIPNHYRSWVVYAFGCENFVKKNLI